MKRNCVEYIYSYSGISIYHLYCKYFRLDVCDKKYVHEFDIITFLCVLIISHTFFYNNTVLSFLGAGRSERK